MGNHVGDQRQSSRSQIKKRIQGDYNMLMIMRNRGRLEMVGMIICSIWYHSIPSLIRKNHGQLLIAKALHSYITYPETMENVPKTKINFMRI